MATGTTGIATYKDILTTYVGGNLDVSVSVDKATTLTEVNNFNTTISNKAKLISASQPNNITSQNYIEQQCVLFTDIQALPIYYFNYAFQNSLGNPVSCDWAMKSWSGTNETATGVFSSTTVSSVTLNITPKDNAYKPRTIQKTGTVPADTAMQIPSVEIITLESYPSAVLSAATTSQTIQTGSDSKSITFTIKGLRVKNLTSSITHSNSKFSGQTCTVSFTNNNALTGETLSETTVTFAYGGGTTALAGLTDNVTITISGTNMNDNSSKEMQLAVTINQYGLGSITGKTDTIPYTGCTNKTYAITTSNIKSALSISPSTNASFNGNNAIITIPSLNENDGEILHSYTISGTDYYGITRTAMLKITQTAAPIHGSIQLIPDIDTTMDALPQSGGTVNIDAEFTGIIGNVTLSVSVQVDSSDDDPNYGYDKSTLSKTVFTENGTTVLTVGDTVCTQTVMTIITATGVDEMGHSITTSETILQSPIGSPYFELKVNDTTYQNGTTVTLPVAHSSQSVTLYYYNCYEYDIVIPKNNNFTISGDGWKEDDVSDVPNYYLINSDLYNNYTGEITFTITYRNLSLAETASIICSGYTFSEVGLAQSEIYEEARFTIVRPAASKPSLTLLFPGLPHAQYGPIDPPKTPSSSLTLTYPKEMQSNIVYVQAIASPVPSGNTINSTIITTPGISSVTSVAIDSTSPYNTYNSTTKEKRSYFKITLPSKTNTTNSSKFYKVGFGVNGYIAPPASATLNITQYGNDGYLYFESANKTFNASATTCAIVLHQEGISGPTSIVLDSDNSSATISPTATTAYAQTITLTTTKNLNSYSREYVLTANCKYQNGNTGTATATLIQQSATGGYMFDSSGNTSIEIRLDNSTSVPCRLKTYLVDLTTLKADSSETAWVDEYGMKIEYLILNQYLSAQWDSTTQKYYDGEVLITFNFGKLPGAGVADTYLFINGKETGYPEKTVSTLFTFFGSGANYSGASARSLSLKNSDVSI